MSTRSGEGDTRGSPWAYCGKLTGLQMAHEVLGRGGQTRHRFEEAPIILLLAPAELFLVRTQGKLTVCRQLGHKNNSRTGKDFFTKFFVA